MNITLGEVLALLAFVAYAVYLLKALRVRELALQAARAACAREDVQLLDENVSIRRFSLSRDGEGRWRVWRQYRFEYSFDGIEREAGHVIMLGYRTQALVMAEQGRTLH
jgi:uncharacterized membrane protein